MKKKEAINYIKNKTGYVSPAFIIDIYDDDDEIPQGLIDIYISDFVPNTNTVFCGTDLAKIFKDLGLY